MKKSKLFCYLILILFYFFISLYQTNAEEIWVKNYAEGIWTRNHNDGAGSSLNIEKWIEKVPLEIEESWAKDYIRELFVRRMFVNINNFEPKKKMTRGEVAIITSRLVEWTHGGYNKTFTDIETGRWHAGSVLDGTNVGILTGYPDGTFKADKEITREETIVILMRTYEKLTNKDILQFEEGIEIEKFEDDTSIGDWSREYIEVARMYGIIAGDENNNFNPNHIITREEMAKMIIQIINKANGIISADNKPLKGYIINSRYTTVKSNDGKISNYDEFREYIIKSFEGEYKQSYGFLTSLVDNYDYNFFKDNSLIIINRYTSSGGTIMDFISATIDENNNVFIKYDVPYIGSILNVGSYCIVVEIPKNINNFNLYDNRIFFKYE